MFTKHREGDIVNGRYEIEREIGNGSYSMVYLVHD